MLGSKVCAPTPGLFLIFLKLFFILLFMYVGVLHACMSVCYVYG